MKPHVQSFWFIPDARPTEIWNLHTFFFFLYGGKHNQKWSSVNDSGRLHVGSLFSQLTVEHSVPRLSRAAAGGETSPNCSCDTRLHKLTPAGGPANPGERIPDAEKEPKTEE